MHSDPSPGPAPSLPAQASALARAPGAPAPADDDPLVTLDGLCQGRRYLVLEESPRDSTWLCRLLGSGGARVVALPSGRVLGAFPYVHTFDVIFVSLVLDREDAFGTLEAILSLGYEGAVVAIVPGGRADDDFLLDFVGGGFCAVLSRPVRTGDLCAVLARVRGRANARA